MRITLQPAFILHQRPYRETSLLIELLTQDYGRVGAVARGVRNTNRKNLRAILQPFSPLLVSWQGRGELMNLYTYEAQALPIRLKGNCLLSAFYINELLIRVLQKNDPCQKLYALYHQTLVMLEQGAHLEKTLRIFEKKLLAELGYGLQLQYDIGTGTEIQPEKIYRFYPDQGFKLYQQENIPEIWIFSGKSLLALSAEMLENTDVLADSKRLMRLALSPLIGIKPLHSRKLFVEIEP